MTVKEVLDKLTGFGLEVRMETGLGHYKIHDPKSGAWLFNVSSSPSDRNWFWNIKRHCRRLGYDWDAASKFRTGKGKKGRNSRRLPAIDVDALARAQAQARAAGERVPEMSDLDESSSSEFWTRTHLGNTTQLSEAAQEEVIENMTARAKDARVILVKSRLRTVFTEQKVKNHAEFVRVANTEVAPARNLRPWPSLNAGQVSVGAFLKDKSTPQIWAINLIEATVDHLNGLKWGVDDSLKKQAQAPEPEPVPTPEPEPEPEPVPVPQPEPELDEDLRTRYAETLFKMLEQSSRHPSRNGDINPILERLDKLVGI